MRLFLPLVCAAAVLTPAVAAAQPAASPAALDARCLITMVLLSNSSDQNAAHMGQLGVVYFAGRVKAHEPNYNFAQLKAVGATLNEQSAQAELKRCGAIVQASLQQLQTALAPPAGAAKPPAAGAAPPVTKTPGK